MIANLNAEQAAALASLIDTHGGPVVIEGGPFGGVRYVTLLIDGDPVRYHLDIDGDVQGAIPFPKEGLPVMTDELTPEIHALGRAIRDCDSMDADPQFDHDCDRCTFLGRARDIRGGRPIDVYTCEQGGVGTTIILRHSDEPPDYSAAEMCWQFIRPPRIRDAALRAIGGHIHDPSSED